MKLLTIPRKIFWTVFVFLAADAAGYGFDLAPKVLELLPAVKSYSNVDKKSGFKQCQSNFFNGVAPIVKYADELKARPICFDGFATLYSASLKIPVFSAEVLNKSKLSPENKQERTGNFYEEARLRNIERATLNDYRGSGFDRGHNFPAGDSDTPEAMAQSFSLANMMPQAPENNRKLWSGYEQSTRKYVKRAQGNVYVITGSIVDPKRCMIELALSGAMPLKYDLNKCTIGNGVTVPTYLYKVVFDPKISRAWAYWAVNTNDAKAELPISYAEIIQRTGIDFFPGANLN